MIAARSAAVSVLLLAASSLAHAQAIDLPTSKQIVKPVPGHPQPLNSLPMSMAASPDGRYVITVNAGYGTVESGYLQSLSVAETATGKVTDYPDERMALKNKHTLYSGLAFSADGQHIFATVASTDDPLGNKPNDLGNGIVVYNFHDGKIAPERILKIPLQKLTPGHTTDLIKENPDNNAVPFPAAIAVLHSATGERLLVADNLSDDALLLDAATGDILHRFDLAESAAVPGTYPIDVRVSKDGTRGFVALWNASEVVELDLRHLTIGRKLDLLKPHSDIAPGTHPSALELSPDGNTLYVALTNRDTVAAVNLASGDFSVKGYFDTRLPGQTYFGAEPETLAVSADGSRLYVGNAISDAVAVIDTRKLTAKAVKQGLVEPIGFFPTEWMPMAMTVVDGKLYVATAKGKGTGPNNFPQRKGSVNGKQQDFGGNRGFTYIATLLHGSLAVLDPSAMEKELPSWTAEVLESNRMKATAEKLDFASGSNPIKHVIYIIKENRTYDQLFGDLAVNGKPVGNGDASLTMYGADITPNQHAMALQFGVMDNFYDSGEVSGDGHVWSNAAIGTDYLEKTWQANYGRGQRTYDWEGMVADGFPIEQHIPDVVEPSSGYLWGNIARNGKTLYHFGEYIESAFCSDKKRPAPKPDSGAGVFDNQLKICERQAINPGEPIPELWGGGISKWKFSIPLLAGNTATKPELVGHFAPEYPNFNLKIPDQLRANIFLRHLKDWVVERNAGHDTMPNFVMLRIANDHTAGTTPGGPTPKSLVADNDLAIGRAVDAIAHSPYWDDTAFFILEDDAQNGADHVDAHRSIALVISKYAPRTKDGSPFVDSRFYTTVSMVRTMEMALGLPPMNNNDAFSSAMQPVFSGPGDQPPFNATYVNQDNNLIYAINPPKAAGAQASLKMDFTRADRADARKLNVILWQDAMGATPVPPQLKVKRKKKKDDDDD
jgi:DNA-binding beta-propeller fold protein YncE